MDECIQVWLVIAERDTGDYYSGTERRILSPSYGMSEVANRIAAKLNGWDKNPERWEHYTTKTGKPRRREVVPPEDPEWTKYTEYSVEGVAVSWVMP